MYFLRPRGQGGDLGGGVGRSGSAGQQGDGSAVSVLGGQGWRPVGGDGQQQGDGCQHVGQNLGGVSVMVSGGQGVGITSGGCLVGGGQGVGLDGQQVGRSAGRAVMVPAGRPESRRGVGDGLGHGLAVATSAGSGRPAVGGRWPVGGPSAVSMVRASATGRGRGHKAGRQARRGWGWPLQCGGGLASMWRAAGCAAEMVSPKNQRFTILGWRSVFGSAVGVVFK